MKLDTWMTKNSISNAAMARLIGASCAAVWKWRHGMRVPRADQMAKIFELTNESVTPNDFFIGKVQRDEGLSRDD